MTPVLVVLELPPKQAEPDDEQKITFVDMDEFSEGNRCSCASSDDNPY